MQQAGSIRDTAPARPSSVAERMGGRRWSDEEGTTVDQEYGREEGAKEGV